MPYVSRDTNGNINGVFANPQDFTSEYLDDADPAVVAFLTPKAAPFSVSQRQARLALAQAGLLDQVNAAVAASDQATQITWDYATEISSNHPMLAAVAAKLNLPLAQIVQLFQTAATL